MSKDNLPPETTLGTITIDGDRDGGLRSAVTVEGVGNVPLKHEVLANTLNIIDPGGLCSPGSAGCEPGEGSGGLPRSSSSPLKEAGGELNDAVITSIVKSLASKGLTATGLSWMASRQTVVVTIPSLGEVLSGLGGFMAVQIAFPAPAGETCPEQCPWKWTDPFQQTNYSQWAAKQGWVWTGERQ